MAHRHNFVEVAVVTRFCKGCGAEGQKCESCDTVCDLADMHSDAEGCWFCPKCWAVMVAESAATMEGSGTP